MTLKRSDTSRSCISKQFKSCMSGTSEPPASRSSGLDKEIWKNEITALLLWFLPLLPPLFYFTGGGRQVRRKGDTCSCILEATLTYAQRQLKPQEPMPSFPDRMSRMSRRDYKSFILYKNKPDIFPRYQLNVAFSPHITGF